MRGCAQQDLVIIGASRIRLSEPAIETLYMSIYMLVPMLYVLSRIRTAVHIKRICASHRDYISSYMIDI